MNYIRELLYRPRKTDRSNMARFFFADENLTQVAAELDSFDGRKDPERCACLVNRLRNCQDKLLNICNKMIEELDPGAIKKSREFRAKYPDDIMNDNLAGQLWFGAECLAAGSSIMNKESESESMRPLAKAVTKSLEKVRQLLREQCLSPQPEYTEGIRENLRIFDRLFADFEFNYVRCMVHVKSASEYELHQDLIVLFSETLMHAIVEELIEQDAVDYCDPSLMFAIPRLAIVYGLLLSSSDGPLNVDRPSSEFPSLFLPFKNLLRKIRELLLTLEASEVMVLEMLLCNLEEPAKISIKLKEVEHKLKEREKAKEGMKQAEMLQAKLNGSDTFIEAVGPACVQKNSLQYDFHQSENTSSSSHTKSRRKSKKRKHHSKRDVIEQPISGSPVPSTQPQKEDISKSTTVTEASPHVESRNSSFSMLDTVDSIPCICDSSFISNHSTDHCNKSIFHDEDSIHIITPIVESLISIAVEKSSHAISMSDTSYIKDVEKLTLDEKSSQGKGNDRKEVEIDCTGPDIEVRISPQRQARQKRHSSNNMSGYHHQSSQDADGSGGNDNMQNMIRDYHQPDGSFSNGTYIPHVSATGAPTHVSSILNQNVSSSSSETIPARRSASISSSLSGMGVPYQIPRPTITQNPSANQFSNSTHISPVTRYYNDPYDVSGSSGHRAGLKRVHARRDKGRIPVRFQKDRRAKFKSTEDLLHRLYVCISGAADQLQSNYAGDFRSILRTVFLMNVSQDEEEPVIKESSLEEVDEEDTNTASQASVQSTVTPMVDHLSENAGATDLNQPTEETETANNENENKSHIESPATVDGATGRVCDDEVDQSARDFGSSPPSVLPSETLQYDIGTDAIQHEGIVSMYAQQLGPSTESRRSMNASLEAGAAWNDVERTANNFENDSIGGAVYARNLDWAQQLRDVQGHDIDQAAHLVPEGAIIHSSTNEGSIANFTSGMINSQTEFYQPEPTLLDIARGAHANTINGENIVSPTSPNTSGLRFESPDLTSSDGPHEVIPPDAGFYEHCSTPPAWIPDEAVTSCMGCRDSFTILRRRHHCRNCGQVFCGRCSSQSTPLPQFRLDRPVRVCNRCFVIIGHQNAADLYGTSPRTPSDYNLSSSPSAENSNSIGNIGSENISAQNPSNTLDTTVTSARQNFYAQNFGMVS